MIFRLPPGLETSVRKTYEQSGPKSHGAGESSERHINVERNQRRLTQGYGQIGGVRIWGISLLQAFTCLISLIHSPSFHLHSQIPAIKLFFNETF